jgi:VanZ family protein
MMSGAVAPINPYFSESGATRRMMSGAVAPINPYFSESGATRRMSIKADQSQSRPVSFLIRNLVLRRLPAPLIIIAIWVLSSQSILPVPKGILGFDKLQHFIAYFVLAGTIGFWFSPDWWQKRRFSAFFISAAIASAYGVVDEIHQYFVPGRNCNVWDWMADTIGAVAGGLALLFLYRLASRRRMRKA